MEFGAIFSSSGQTGINLARELIIIFKKIALLLNSSKNSFDLGNKERYKKDICNQDANLEYSRVIKRNFFNVVNYIFIDLFFNHFVAKMKDKIIMIVFKIGIDFSFN